MTLFQIFHTGDGRTINILQCAQPQAMAYACAMGGAYDYARAKPGFYVSRYNGKRTDILTACYPTRFDAQRRADFENMANDAYSFAVIESPA